MNSTIVGLVAAIAVLSGALGFSTTGIFDDQNLMTSDLPTTGFLMGQVVIEARDADGELFAYRQSDNEVVDDGEQCILKMLFGDGKEAQPAGRGGYVSTADGLASGGGACSGILSGAWNVIAIGDCNTTAECSAAFDSGNSIALQDLTIGLGNETSGVVGLNRGVATSITWHNGTGDTATKIVLAKTFTATGTDAATTHAIGESGLFNSSTNDAQGMLARQTFTDVSLSSGDSITVTWTFTVGN